MKTPFVFNWCGGPLRGLLLAAAAWLPLAILNQPAHGVGTILSTGFDTSYSNGALQSQNGWLTAGLGPTTGPTASTAEVQSSTYLTAGKGVTVSRAANILGDRRWGKPVTGYPTQRFVTIDWDMNVTQTTPVAYGPFFGVDAYDADVAPYVLGSLGVDATTGDVVYQLQNSGYVELSGSTVAFDVWNHFRMVLDFATDSYHSYVNGSLVASTGFVDRGFNLDNFTDADIATFATNGDPDSLAMPGTAYFDNFVIRDGLMGDYDIDGDVDESDDTRWRTTFGSTVATPGNLADGSGSAMVDAADYVAWRKNLGQSLFSGTGSGGAPVPEPANALCLFASSILILLASRRRRINGWD